MNQKEFDEIRIKRESDIERRVNGINNLEMNSFGKQICYLLITGAAGEIHSLNATLQELSQTYSLRYTPKLMSLDGRSINKAILPGEYKEFIN